jgi:2-(1,2-epoxy-1,2-dihydrophenyl)acetyl-CoA isomerase
MSQTIHFLKKDLTAYITLNRPEAFNSFNREMALEFLAKLDECENDPEIRVVVLSANGKAFCAGQDLKEVLDPETMIGFERLVDEHYNAMIRKIVNLTKPVIAAVNGVAAGAGANIALASDIVIAKQSASFIQAFSKIGLIPDSGGTYILPRLIGYQKAKALCMMGDKITAEQAERMNMIYKVCEDEIFADVVQKTADNLAMLPPIGIQLTKKLFSASANNSLDEQLELEKKYQIEAGNTEDYNECVNAFVEKRKPIIKGK